MIPPLNSTLDFRDSERESPVDFFKRQIDSRIYHYAINMSAAAVNAPQNTALVSFCRV